MRPEVEAALRGVPRHLFTPGAALEEAYRADQAVITKRVGDEVVSSVSASWLIAEMLGQAADATEGGLRGRQVLEIGSGGYSAALLRELVGPSVRSRPWTSTGRHRPGRDVRRPAGACGWRPASPPPRPVRDRAGLPRRHRWRRARLDAEPGDQRVRKGPDGAAEVATLGRRHFNSREAEPRGRAYAPAAYVGLCVAEGHVSGTNRSALPTAAVRGPAAGL